MTDYPPTEYTDWQRARGHMSGAVPLRTLEQARADLVQKPPRLSQQEIWDLRLLLGRFLEDAE